MPVPNKPEVPITEDVSHFKITLSWERSLEANEDNSITGDARCKVHLQQEHTGGQWNTIYQGYDKRYAVTNAEPQTTYGFRIRLQNEEGFSDWSPVLTVTTHREPLTGIQLHKAIQMNDASGAERILETGEVNVEVTDKYGHTALMQAASKGYTELIELLVRYNADVNTQNDAGKTALMLAAYTGKLESIQVLREHNAQHDIRDKGGSTALHWAVDGQCIDCIEWCLDDGWDPNVKDTGSKWTPLHRCAAVNGNKDVARVLLKAGADVDAVDADGKTPLMIAVINGHQAMVEVLLSGHADVTIKNSFGKNALEMAASMDKRRIIKLLDDHVMKYKIEIKKSRVD